MRQAALAFRNQIRRLGKVKRTGRDEQHVVGLDRAVLGADGAALDQRQQIALHAFARDIRAAGVLAALADLVDLVDEDDAVFFGVADRLGADRLRSEEHTSELQSLMRNSYAVFCLKKKHKHNIL